MYKTRRHRRNECVTVAIRQTIVVGTLFMLFVAQAVIAQQFTFQHYGQQEGLSNLVVDCIIQDHSGFLWACTENGLYRYDGSDFEHFGESEGLDNRPIWSAVEDSSGRIWASTPGELYLGDARGFQVVRPGGHSLKIEPGRRIAALPPNGLLAISNDGLVEIGPSGRSGSWQSRPFFTAEQLHRTPALQQLSSLHVDRQGRIWLACGSSICEIEHGRLEIWDAQSGVPADTWRSWLVDRKEALWVRGLNHVVVLPAGANRFEERDPPHAKLTADILNVPITADGEGRIITRTDAGLARWQNGRWQELTAENGVPPTGIAALLSDRDGTLWLGFAGHGLLRWLGYRNFESWIVASGVDTNPIWSMLRDPDRGIVMGTRTGCSRIDRALTQAVPCGFNNLPAGEIQLVAERRDGSLWIGMTTGELLRVAAGEQHAVLISKLPLMRRLYVDSLDRLWICSNTGVHLIAPGRTQVQEMPLPFDVGEVTDAVEDAHGTLWIATQGGLLHWSGGPWKLLKIDEEHARNGFTSIATSAGDWLWAGTTTHGVMHLHLADDHVDRAEWIAEPTVARASTYFVREDSRRWIWIGTDSGIAVFDGTLWKRFSQRDGLVWNDIDQNAFFEDTDGSIWIGTSGGVTHIQRPESLLRTQPLDLKITHATLGAIALDPSTTRRLPWDSNAALNLHLVDLDYGQAHQIRFKVRLHGLSDAWFATYNPELHYPGLGPGVYRFEAVAIDPDHRRSSPLATLSFEVLPPWWQTLWFRFVVALALCALVAAAWHLRMRSLRAYRLKLERQLRVHAELLERATRDSLTKLWNRTAILEILSREIELARRSSAPLAVVIIDVDHFKHINDTRGHLCGDAVLRALGAELAANVRRTDFIGRYGGEEFLLVVPGAPEQRPFPSLERLRQVIAEVPIDYKDASISITASFGMAWFVHDSDTAETFLARADTALYTAKCAGRNRIEYADPISNTVTRMRSPVASLGITL
jgi:diguanylate cyclase (GGDEF)-like protein